MRLSMVLRFGIASVVGGPVVENVLMRRIRILHIRTFSLSEGAKS